MDLDQVERTISMLNAVPGFDCQDGITRIFGNKELYFKLITLFFSNRHTEQIRIALQENDFSLAFGEAHALKGAASNMGFKRIAELADAIGKSLKNNQLSSAWDSLDALEQVLANAMSALQITGFHE